MKLRKVLWSSAVSFAWFPVAATAQSVPVDSASRLPGATPADTQAPSTTGNPQTTDVAAGSGAQADSGQLPDIVVTAQRRSERLQDVPIAVTAIGGADLQGSGIARTNDLGQVVPSLFVQKSGQAVTPFLRGVGNGSANIGNDPSIALYIDGVYQSAPFGLLFSLADIERIEVLKGPQGTLFGRNATGGLINVVTSDPKAGLSGRFEVGYGNYRTVESKAYLTGGSDKLAGSVSLLYRKQNEGWGRNIATPDQAGPQSVNGVPVTVPYPRYPDAGFVDEFGVTAKIKAVIGDATTIRLSGRYFETAGDQGEYRRGLPGAILSASGAVPYVFAGGFYDEASDVSYHYQNHQYAGSAEITHEASFATLKSISSYLSFRSLSDVPTDSTPQISQTNVLGTSPAIDTFTQELQLLSNHGRVDWIVGAFYLDSKANIGPSPLFRGYLEPSLSINGHQHSKSKAVFAQVGFNIFRNTKLTGGIRYTKDDFTADQFYQGTRTSTIPAPPATFALGAISNLVPEQKTSSDAVTFRVALDHRFSSEALVYASFSRGYKAGGFNVGGMCLTSPAPLGLCPQIANPVNPEFLDDIEVGLKTDLFDRHLRLNVSAFHYDYSNVQVQVVTGSPPVFTLTNAASAKLYGAEVEGEASFTRRFSATFGLSLLHTEYENFSNAPIFVPRLVAPYNNVAVVADSLKGNQLNRSPKTTVNLGLNYKLPTSVGDFALSGNYYHNSGFFWEPSNRVRQEAYDLLNAQIEYTLPNSTASIRLWARNLTATKYLTYVSVSTSGDQGSPGAPRTYGATLRYAF